MALKTFTDMLGRQVAVSYPPQRIVSVVPSQTELLSDLGLEDEVVGITKFCVHPVDWFRNKTRVGGTKKLHIDEIAALKPDLIIANKEENTQEQIEELSKLFPVWISNIQTVEDALEMIRSVGMLVDKEEKANSLALDIATGFEDLYEDKVAKRVAYFMWRDPWMCAGGDTFINDLIKKAGWVNVFADRLRYPEVTLEEVAALNPDLILLSSEPFPFHEKHVAEIEDAIPHRQAVLVDGEMFSWYGSRMLEAIPYLDALIKSI